MEELRKEIVTIKGQLAYLTKLVETMAQEDKPCAENQAKNEALGMVMSAIKTNPVLQNHPMFKDLMGPLEKILGGARR